MREEEIVVLSPETNLVEADRPKPWTLVGLLAGVALVVSYLAAYAVTNALVATEVIAKWSPGHDPRPGWMVRTFLSMIGAFGAIALLFKWSGRRQMRRIDEMGEGEVV